MDQRYLLDRNLYKTIARCFINKKHPSMSEIFVVYSDDSRETIWTFNPTRYEFTHHEFLGKTKIEAVFHCDRKQPKSLNLY